MIKVIYRFIGNIDNPRFIKEFKTYADAEEWIRDQPIFVFSMARDL